MGITWFSGGFGGSGEQGLVRILGRNEFLRFVNLTGFDGVGLKLVVILGLTEEKVAEVIAAIGGEKALS